LIVLGLQAQINTGKLNTSALRGPQLSMGQAGPVFDPEISKSGTFIG